MFMVIGWLSIFIMRLRGKRPFFTAFPEKPNCRFQTELTLIGEFGSKYVKQHNAIWARSQYFWMDLLRLPIACNSCGNQIPNPWQINTGTHSAVGRMFQTVDGVQPSMHEHSCLLLCHPGKFPDRYRGMPPGQVETGHDILSTLVINPIHGTTATILAL